MCDTQGVHAGRAWYLFSREKGQFSILQSVRESCLEYQTLFLTRARGSGHETNHKVCCACIFLVSCKLFRCCTCVPHVLHMYYTLSPHVLHMYCTLSPHVLHMYYTCTTHYLHMYCTCTAHISTRTAHSTDHC